MNQLLKSYLPIEKKLQEYGFSRVEGVSEGSLLLASYRRDVWYLETCFSKGGGTMRLDLTAEHPLGEATLCYTNPCSSKLTKQMVTEIIPSLLIDCMLDAINSNMKH